MDTVECAGTIPFFIKQAAVLKKMVPWNLDVLKRYLKFNPWDRIGYESTMRDLEEHIWDGLLSKALKHKKLSLRKGWKLSRPGTPALSYEDARAAREGAARAWMKNNKGQARELRYILRSSGAFPENMTLSDWIRNFGRFTTMTPVAI